MLTLYKIISTLIYLAAYLFGRNKANGGSDLWRGRLGLIDKIGPVDIWMHASSVGEAKVLSYLVEYLLNRKPLLKIHLTTMTVTGQKMARQLLGDRVTLSFLPIDATSAVNRTLDALSPSMIVFAETEIWPNLIRAANKRDIKMVLVNGRMSQSAFSKYSKINKSIGRLLLSYDRFFLQSEVYRERYGSFGVLPPKMQVVGDMKFDAPLNSLSDERRKELRELCGVNDEHFLLVAGSTRKGEDEHIIGAYQTVLAQNKNVRLLIAPRHPERTGEIKALLEASQIEYFIYGTKPKTESVVLVDRIGLLTELYGAADCCFVGGTLVDIGGHNILEPVWSGVPVVYGQSVTNVGDAAEYISEHNYGKMIKSSDELASLIIGMMNGAHSFKQKSNTTLTNTATVMAGDYILRAAKNV